VRSSAARSATLTPFSSLGLPRYGEMKPSVIASKNSIAAVVDATANGLAKSDKGVPSHVIS
jgi:hypothetical protein